MADPTSSTAVIATTAAGVGLASMVPWLDANALIGAIFGAAVVAMTKKDLSPLSRLIGLLLSTLAGYISAPEIVANSWLTQTGSAGAVGAVVIIPLLLKLLSYVEKMDLASLLRPKSGG